MTLSHDCVLGSLSGTLTEPPVVNFNINTILKISIYFITDCFDTF